MVNGAKCIQGAAVWFGWYQCAEKKNDIGCTDWAFSFVNATFPDRPVQFKPVEGPIPTWKRKTHSRVSRSKNWHRRLPTMDIEKRRLWTAGSLCWPLKSLYRDIHMLEWVSLLQSHLGNRCILAITTRVLCMHTFATVSISQFGKNNKLWKSRGICLKSKRVNSMRR